MLCRAAADDDMVNSIMEATQHPLALDAMASIWFSPRSERPFGQLAAAAASTCPACLIYGKEDPCAPPFQHRGPIYSLLVPLQRPVFLSRCFAFACAHTFYPVNKRHRTM